jgi:branched-subunit amino acid aminotransferase/4-amino-4-deoxychorismate lyase
MEKVIFYNGKFLISPESPKLDPDSGLLRGIGLFETMRAYQGNIIYFTRHIARIRNSAKFFGLGFSYDSARIKKIIVRLLESNALSHACVRLTFWRTGRRAEILIMAKKYKPLPFSKYRKGFSAAIAPFSQDENSLLAQHKTTSRLIYEQNFCQAKTRGFDEAIMLNQRGYISEGTRANIFFVKDNALFTPTLDCGCLNGITRRVVFDFCSQYRIRLYEGKFTLEQLYAAEGAFLTNSLLGIMPLASVGKKHFFKAARPKITGLLMRKYGDLLRRAG